ncbi:class 1 fructose-bisphosphatase [Thalassococcus lentus]|uniref:Fructose-1,6-bisphosphatase class 1 n=1 Tax=Thalassococcus lentus TaxID=1210524 RepID=A0ABT4XQC0_9RHOB|nr:class 1 fructose-bisphosphatase [Thalassococcus lentus]MDA7424097.1 class 1 fructose-bisphosphatase [Thalassococcus lentus]
MTGQARVSLTAFIADEQDDPHLGALVDAVASACWSISRIVRKAALDGNLGTTNCHNVQGEDQKPLDILANDEFFRALGQCPQVAAVLSEEVGEVIWMKAPKRGDFTLSCDPLDGSSNLDANLSVGTIFAVGQVANDGDRTVLKTGRSLRCAGYAVYGPSTMFVLALNGQVNGFTLDEDADDFVLTHPNLKIPPETSEFAINASRQAHWDDAVTDYVEGCIAGEQGPRAKTFNMRWTASMVADVHRILTRGGVFLYPADAQNRSQGGKLRLMYEAIPMAMIAEAAGGAATDGIAPILDIEPQGPHQRIAVVLGSSSEVSLIADGYR